MFKTFCTSALLAFAVASAFETYEYTDGRDNQKYPVVKIGETSIFAKNLNFNQKGSFCYDDNPANCKTFGRLYTWGNALDACPMGWTLMDEETMQTLEKDKKAFSQFRLTAGGFRNSKGKYELIDKRLDLWLSDGDDDKKSKYWFYSTSSNKSDFSSYSISGAMSVRCVNFFEPENCNYECMCDHGFDYPEAKEFENDQILICTYTFESRSGEMNPSCPREFNHYTRYWKKTSPAPIAECPEPYGEEYETFEGQSLFVGYNDKTDFVIHENQLCILGEDGDAYAKYTRCIPLSRAADKLTPAGQKLFRKSLSH